MRKICVIITKWSGTGISAMQRDEFVGKKALREFAIDELIEG